MGGSKRAIWTCTSCLRDGRRHSQRLLSLRVDPTRAFTTRSALSAERPVAQPSNGTEEEKDGPKPSKEQGAMSRRLTEMAEELMDTGSRSDRKQMAQAGFSDELKKQLEERIAQAVPQLQNQQAFSQVNMPSSAGQGTREQAAARPWTGNESVEDAALRMLDDSHKRLRTPASSSSRVAGPPIRPPTLKKKKISAADRLANARDKTSIYAMQQDEMSEDERERFRKELKERFTAGARPMPTSLQGLTSLANERIEDAIARGQFRNIQRGKGVNIERDYNANSPFLDTTEYFMNKLIQKQDIVPPWIEKQQELMKMVNTFRKRMRNDWRRHAARTIASKGGRIEDQVRRARGYALAEEIVNPRPTTRSESMSSIDASGNLASITVEERIATGVAADPIDDPVSIKVTASSPSEASISPPSLPSSPGTTTTTTTATAAASSTLAAAAAAAADVADAGNTAPINRDTHVLPTAYPFRDPQWEAAEASYHALAINEINSLARSYNLMAPKIAQKPYYSLSRELKRCYADVAPQLADEILERSRKPPVKIQVSLHREGSVMEKFQGTGHVSRIRDEPGERGYGFKQFWKDLFSKKDEREGGEKRSVY